MLQHVSVLYAFWDRMIFHCVDRPHFVHSSTDGCLGYLLAIVNSAAINIHVQEFEKKFWTPIFSSFGCIGVESPGRVVIILCLITKWFSIAAVPFYIPTNDALGSFSTHLHQYLFSFYFYYGLPSVCEVIPHCGFDLYFPNDHRCWTSFHVLFGHFWRNISLEKRLFKSFAHFSVVSFCCWTVGILYRFWILDAFVGCNLSTSNSCACEGQELLDWAVLRTDPAQVWRSTSLLCFPGLVPSPLSLNGFICNMW